MESVKDKLRAKCFEYVEQRIESSRQAMKDAQDSANTEEKSSAGDKYETGRAMAQIERDKAAQQLDEAMKLKAILNQINPIARIAKVVQGSLVITESNRFYLAISVGKVTVDGLDFLVIAPNSPIGQTLLNLNVNNQFTFNKKVHTITEIL
jgi:transcription elongation GreA/GreB family factor